MRDNSWDDVAGAKLEYFLTSAVGVLVSQFILQDQLINSLTQFFFLNQRTSKRKTEVKGVKVFKIINNDG